jgi:hypothetical protein
VKRILVALALVAAVPVLLDAGPVKFSNTFIELFKNRVTIDVSFTVDKSHSSPNTISDDGDDGDLHAAGRAPEVGLPMVVEIANARDAVQKAIVDKMKERVGKPASSLSGVWRIWYEHPSATVQEQFETVPVADSTNPKHVFEVHPVTSFAGISAHSSFIPIPGYSAYAATTAFPHYEALKLTVSRDADFTTMKSSTARYNYTEFDIVLSGAPADVVDGVMVLADVVDSAGVSIVAAARRMVCAAGTPPAETIRKAKSGAKFKVLGIPRVNLERVSALAVNDATVVLVGAYEMIIVGIVP